MASTSRTDATGTTGYVYDGINGLTQKTPAGGPAMNYGYDPAGNLTSATDATGTTIYTYDRANLVTQLTEPGGRIDIFAYDADHRRGDTWDAATYTGGGGVRYDAYGNVVAPSGFAAHIHAGFDTAGHLVGLRSTRASSDADANRVGDLTYAYVVPAGCAGATPGRSTDTRQSVTDRLTARTTTYCYDGGAHLTQAATPGAATYAYAYDPAGNRTSGPEGSHLAANSASQVTDAGFAYNADGGLTASPALPVLAYNGIAQTTSMTAAGQGALPLAYAGSTQDERTTAGPQSIGLLGTQTFTYQNGLTGIESQSTQSCSLLLVCNTVVAGFVRDPGGALVAERIGTDEYYYVFDGLGSVVALVDAGGTQRAAYTYDPYGAHATATGVNGALPPDPFRYAGGALDATGLYHFGARYYDPAIGRWTQQDSVASLGDPSNGNRYAYAGDDPVNHLDPSGRDDCGDISLDGFQSCGSDLVNYVEDNPVQAVGNAFGCAIGGVGGYEFGTAVAVATSEIPGVDAVTAVVAPAAGALGGCAAGVSFAESGTPLP